MKEIRLHGIGGQGTVKAGELLVHAAVAGGKNGNAIPMFGFERQGAPVTSYVRLDDDIIKPKNQVYYPDALIVIDSTVMNTQDVFEGVKEDAIFVVNTDLTDLSSMNIPANVKTVASVDATKLSKEILNRDIPNTVMLGAFAKATGWVGEKELEDVVAKTFGEKNRDAFKAGFDQVKVVKL